MKILCYGDSNTWGTISDGSCKQLDTNKRYSTLLKKELFNNGINAEVICEGLPTRNTNLDDIKFPKGNRNGSLFFAQCLISHNPLDYVVIALGANDMKAKFNRSAKESAEAIEKDYINFTKKYLYQELTKVPKFIICTPPIIDETKFEGFEGAGEKSKHFNDEFKLIAKRNDCLFISNKEQYVGLDGVHLTEESHKHLAKSIANEILDNMNV